MRDNNADLNKKALIGGKLFKIFIGFWVVVTVAIIIYFVTINIMRAGKIGVMIKCAPYNAQLTINDESANNNAMVYLKEDEYDFKCSLDGFTTIDENVKVSEENNVLIFELLPETEEAKKFMEDHMDDYYDAEKYYLEKKGINSISTEYNEKEQKLTNLLPYTTDNYGIGTLLDDDKFYVTMTVWEPQYTQMAVYQLLELAKSADVSIADYNVRINDFKNQLSNIEENESVALGDYIKNGYSGVNLEVRDIGKIGGYDYALISVAQPSGGRVIYRALFIKENGRFKLIATPYPVLTSVNTPGVDIEVLDEINDKRVVTIQE